ncbi:MAG: YcxB family protein [Massilia sp.]
MFGFNHPRPAGSGKPVAVLVQEDDGDPSVVAVTAAVPGGSVPANAAVGAGLCELHFWVKYSLGEYASFMWQHNGFLIRRRRIPWPTASYMRARSTATAALHFVLSGRGRRTYELTIDQHGIVRTSDTGVTLIDWADVMSLRPYSRGLMMVLKRGTLPIPFRCLKANEADVLRGLVTAHKGGAAA